MEVERHWRKGDIGGRAALEVELGVLPLDLRGQELAIREGAKIMSKTNDDRFKHKWIDWETNTSYERHISPFGIINLQLEETKSQTKIILLNIEDHQSEPSP